MYLPGAAQEQLYGAVDSFAPRGSHIALEEMLPMGADELEAKRAEERAEGDARFFNLIYNERPQDAVHWFGERGWDVESTLASDYYERMGRPLPSADTDAGQMLRTGSLVTAAKI